MSNLADTAKKLDLRVDFRTRADRLVDSQRERERVRDGAADYRHSDGLVLDHRRPRVSRRSGGSAASASAGCVGDE